MPTYVNLMKLTDQGIKDIKGFAPRLEAGVKGLEAQGGKLIGFYALMGEYDYLVIAEGPNDEVATAVSVWLSSLGNVRTTTLRAFTSAEFAEVIKKLP